MSDMTRITGMVSGMDTDALVEKLVNLEQTKVDKVEQERTYTEWQQEAYRDMSNTIRAFKDEYFDFLNSDTNMRSASTFNSSKVSYGSTIDSNYVEISSNVDTVQTNYTISNITTAKAAKVTSASSITDVIGDALTTPVDITASNNKFALTLNGITKEITLDSKNYDGTTDNTLSDLATDIQTKIAEVFGAGKVTVTENSGQIKFDASTNDLSLSEPIADSALATLGFADGVNKSNKIDLEANLSDIESNFTIDSNLGGTTNDIDFDINGQNFKFSSTETSLNDIIKEVNASDAGVKMRYDELSDQMIVETEATGATTNLEITDNTGNLMAALGIDQTATGEDATLTYNDGSGDKTVTRPSNNFEVNGVNIKLKNDYGGTIDFTVESDTEGLVEDIKGFVDKYNEMIGKINDELGEKRYRDYQPLSDDEKEAMSDKEVEMWEERAKSGILRNDDILERMVTNMRSSLYEQVEGAGLHLSDLGITTSTNYRDGGKLVVDEDKLTTAIEDDPQKVADLFTQDGDTYETKGLSHRLYDIIQDNIRVTRDSNGRKGALIEKAGIEGDITEFRNSLTEKMNDYDDRIDDLLDDISRKEDNYYNMFAQMESALQRMNDEFMQFQSQL